MSMPSLPKNFARAVDLSALAAPKNQNANQAINVTAENLVQEFLGASHKNVVILLCWSPRSAQSQQVLDILAKFNAADLANPDQSKWILGSVNVDAQPAVAQALQVQSVPYAVALIQEQIVPLFESVPPEAQIRLVIDKVLSLAFEKGVGTAPVAGSTGTPVSTEPPMEPEELEAMKALEAGDFPAAKVAYQKWLQRSPFDPMAKIGLAQTELFIRTSGIDSGVAISEADADLTNIEKQLLAADLELLLGSYQESFSRLTNLVKLTSGDDRKLVREHLLELFTLIDPADLILAKARQALASALF